MAKSIYSEQYRVMLRLLKDIRIEQAVTQADLMGRLRLDQSTISRIETGDRRLDAIELRNYCLALGLTFSDFVKRFERLLEKNESM